MTIALVIISFQITESNKSDISFFLDESKVVALLNIKTDVFYEKPVI